MPWQQAHTVTSEAGPHLGRGADGGPGAGGEVRLAPRNGCKNLRLAVPIEGRAATQQDVGNHAGAPDVRLLAILLTQHLGAPTTTPQGVVVSEGVEGWGSGEEHRLLASCAGHSALALAAHFACVLTPLLTLAPTSGAT
jgi:hypothetical protein